MKEINKELTLYEYSLIGEYIQMVKKRDVPWSRMKYCAECISNLSEKIKKN